MSMSPGMASLSISQVSRVTESFEVVEPRHPAGLEVWRFFEAIACRKGRVFQETATECGSGK